jgi:hypothetical protein
LSASSLHPTFNFQASAKICPCQYAILILLYGAYSSHSEIPSPLTHSIIEFKHLLCWYVPENTKRLKRRRKV